MSNKIKVVTIEEFINLIKSDDEYKHISPEEKELIGYRDQVMLMLFLSQRDCERTYYIFCRVRFFAP